MSYDIAYQSSVEREMKRLPRNILLRIDTVIMSLKEMPRPAGCVKLTGVEAYRVRVGDYRILYTLNDARQIIVVQAVRHRREAYRGL